MGELLFTLGYGGALVVVGLLTFVLLKKMEQEIHVEEEEYFDEERTV